MTRTRLQHYVKFWGIFWYQLYLLQLENYEIRRFFKIVWQQLTTAKMFLPPPAPWRKSLVWTGKFCSLVALCAAFLGVGSYFASTHSLWLMLIFVSGYFLFPFVFITLALVLLKPIDWSIKANVVWRAKRHLAKFPNVKIIGIAGSYGKTTVKEFIANVLGQKYSVLVTPENINTPLGIARLLLTKLNQQTEWLVIEMGEYYRGDIKDICGLTPPDIAVVTGVNEAHLERLGTLANTLMTIFEVVQYSKSNAVAVLNADDPNVHAHFKAFVKHHHVNWYSITNANADAFPTKLLASYARGSADAAVIIGRLLHIADPSIQKGIAAVEPIPHRLQPIQTSSGVLVIDDSYNGNPAGVHEAIEVLKKYPERRKLFITPGLVEMGSQSESVHVAIGRQLAEVADCVILIKNSVTPFIANGLQMNNFAKENIIWFNTALEAHAGLKDILKPNDVILFQNDWGDNYV